MKGGNFYGPGGAIAPGAMQWDAVANNGARPDGTILAGDADLSASKVGGRRRRTSKKTRKGGRKSRASRASRKVGGRRRKTMRGGANFYSPSTAGGSFVGSGSAGLLNLKAYSVNTPAGGPQIGADGVSRTS
jgi:hypothetical protein